MTHSPGLSDFVPRSPHYEVIILGAGPAGLQAAIHAARKKVRVLVLGRPSASSLFRSHIENYCCVPGVKTGEQLLKTGKEQAEGFGAEFLEEDAVRTESLGEASGFRMTTESGLILTADTLIMATGVSRRGVGLKGEKDLVGRGISYCVDCDANFYRDQVVAVVGNGSAAAHGAVTLSKIASQVTLITQDLQVSPWLKNDLEKGEVRILSGRTVRKLRDEGHLTGVVLDDGTELPLDGLFIEKGAKGAMELAAFLGVSLDPEKLTYIVTDADQATNITGIFACGDVCGPPFQMAKAVGEGCVAGMSASTYAMRKGQQKKGLS